MSTQDPDPVESTSPETSGVDVKPPPLASLDPFLSPTNSRVINSQTWISKIFADQNLTSEPGVSVLQNQTDEATFSSLLLSWKPKDRNGNSVDTYQFSSERNSAFFLNKPSDLPTVQNTCSVGDAKKSGILLVRSGPTSTSLYDRVLPAFDVKDNDHQLFADLLKAIDATHTVNATLKPPASWVPSNPDHLPPDSNIRNRKPLNAAWCSVLDRQYRVVISLTYGLQISASTLGAWISNNFGGLKSAFLNSSNPQSTIAVDLTLTKSVTYAVDPVKGTQIAFNRTTISLAIPISKFVIHLDFEGSSMRVLLVPTGNDSSISSMISNEFGSSKTTGDSSKLPTGQGNADTSIFSKAFKAVHPWYVGLTIPYRSPKSVGGSSAANLPVTWEFGLLAELQGSQTIVLAFSYDSRSKTFIGQTIFDQGAQSANFSRRIGWDPRLDVVAALSSRGMNSPLPTQIDILALVGLNDNNSPIAPKLKAARVTYGPGEVSNSTLLTVYGAFQVGALKNSAFPLLLNTASIDVRVLKTGSDTHCSLVASDVCNIVGTFSAAEQAMDPKPAAPSCSMAVRLAYNSFQQQQTWSLRATANNLSVGLIRSFFDSQTDQGGIAVIDKITLASLDIKYVFAGPNATSFNSKGVIRLGELELDLIFNRTPSNWTFEATLGAKSQSSTIGSIAESIVPGSKAKIPEFVGGIKVNTGNSGAAPACLLKFQSNTDTSKGGITSLLTVWLTIAGFSLTFLQYRVTTAGTNQDAVKRVLRISVDQIPMMDHIPLVGKMPQPFDHLLYAWVEDSNADASVTPPVNPSNLGISQEEAAGLQSLMPTYIFPLQSKEAKKGSSGGTALAIGHHFLVIVSGQVILDHVFDTSNSETVPKGLLPEHRQVQTLGPTTTSPDAQPTKGSTKLQAGPLSIGGLTLQYKQGHLVVSIDATLDLGAISFSVIGFTLDIDLTQVKLDHLADIIAKGLITASLNGLELSLEKGPLTLQGVFIHSKEATYESYRGGVAVGFKAWQILAVGEYLVHLKSDNTEDYKAFFMYGKLDGPLVELAFATISGVRVGFGYNYAVRMPDLNELITFPFVNDSSLKGKGGSPAGVLEAIRGTSKPFVYIKQGSAWFAAGMTITAFEVLTLTAVLILGIDSATDDTGGVNIAMFGDGIFQMPPRSDPDLTLFYIELVIKVELNFAQGYVAADAALAPTSHILVPSAKLVGSASFYSWFGKNPHAGDWVVSIGGYAKDYVPAPWYPRPSRIGLNFTVGDNIQIIGQGYCAVTPKCAMAGGSLHLALSVGPVSAYADLIFDAYINFEPFHFRASLLVAIGVSCDVDILFVQVHVNVHVGADIVVWGPNEFGGRAHVDFWFFAFDIAFGSIEDATANRAIPLDSFVDMVTKPGPDHAASSTDTVGGVGDPNTLHKYSVESGLAFQGPPPPATAAGDFPSTGATSVFKVLAGPLALRIDCGFALSEAKLTLPNNQAPRTILLPDGSQAPAVFSWPMHCTASQNLTSSLSVTVKKIIDDHNQPVQGGFRAELVTKTASTAMWSVWDAARDPLFNDKTPPSLTNANGGLVNLVHGVRILPPKPGRITSRIIEFNPSLAMNSTILPQLPLPARGPPQGAQYGPVYFEDKDGSGNPIDGTTRWNDFKQMWIPLNQADPPVEAVSARRKEMVNQIAQVLEWWIRPADQMAKNDAPPGSNIVAIKTSVVANAPRNLASGRTDWQLVDEQPSGMVSLLDVYCPALPYVCV